jgi:hypothetical protein
LTPVKNKDTPLVENTYTKENSLTVKIVSNTKLDENFNHIVIDHDGKFFF